MAAAEGRESKAKRFIMSFPVQSWTCCEARSAFGDCLASMVHPSSIESVAGTCGVTGNPLAAVCKREEELIPRGLRS
jgi:hypothetical protein